MAISFVNKDGMTLNQHNSKYIIAVALLVVFVVGFSENVCAEPFYENQLGIGISIAAVITIVGILLGFFFLSGGIKYVTPDNVLDTEIRRDLYNYIDTYPGSHLREIARELKLKPSNASWHLRKLEQTNLVRSRTIGGKKVYYLVEGGVEAGNQAVAESVLRNNNAQEIMGYLVDNPGKHLLEIAHALDLNHHVVKWHIQKMQEVELVAGDSTNSAYPIYYPTKEGAGTLRSMRRRSIDKAA